MRTAHLLTVSRSIRWGGVDLPNPSLDADPLPGCRPAWMQTLRMHNPHSLWTDKHLWKDNLRIDITSFTVDENSKTHEH